MIPLTGQIATTIGNETTTLCRLAQVVLSNGQTFYYTDLDTDITYAGNVFPRANACSISQLQTILGTSTQAVSIDVLLLGTALTAALIDNGALDDARVTVYVVDYTSNPVSGFTLWSGYVDQVSYKDDLTGTLDCQPLIDRDVTLALDSYCMNCRADLGDAKCGFNIDSLKKTGEVTSYTNLQTFVTNNTDVNGKWNNGLICFTSGANAGFNFEIQSSADDGTITLKLLTPYPVAAADAFTIYPGCDKTPETCNDVFDNMVNFRGEPFTISPWAATAANPAPIPNPPTPAPVQQVQAPPPWPFGYRDGIVLNP